MTRPIYEKPSDRITQRKIIKKYIKSFDYPIGIKEMPVLHPFDFALYEKDVENLVSLKSIAEVKKRLVDHNTYKEIILSKYKVDRCVDIAERHKITFLFIVEFNDGIFYTKMFETVDRYEKGIKKVFRTSFGGRTDRNDSHDVEDCYMIPNICFEKVLDKGDS